MSNWYSADFLGKALCSWIRLNNVDAFSVVHQRTAKACSVSKTFTYLDFMFMNWLVTNNKQKPGTKVSLVLRSKLESNEVSAQSAKLFNGITQLLYLSLMTDYLLNLFLKAIHSFMSSFTPNSFCWTHVSVEEPTWWKCVPLKIQTSNYSKKVHLWWCLWSNETRGS